MYTRREHTLRIAPAAAPADPGAAPAAPAGPAAPPRPQAELQVPTYQCAVPGRVPQIICGAKALRAFAPLLRILLDPRCGAVALCPEDEEDRAGDARAELRRAGADFVLFQWAHPSELARQSPLTAAQAWNLAAAWAALLQVEHPHLWVSKARLVEIDVSASMQEVWLEAHPGENISVTEVVKENLDSGDTDADLFLLFDAGDESHDDLQAVLNLLGEVPDLAPTPR